MTIRYLHRSHRASYIDVRDDIDGLAVTNFVLTLLEAYLWGSSLLTASASTAWFNIDRQLLLIGTIGVANGHSIDTGSIGCGTIENQTVVLNAKQRWDGLIPLVSAFLPVDVNGILRLENNISSFRSMSVLFHLQQRCIEQSYVDLLSS
jgi:hypothetical protein